MIILFLAYQAVLVLIFPVFVSVLIARIIRKKPVFGGFKQRLGFVPKIPRKMDSTAKIVWFHAVSVGEVLSVQSIIEKIKKLSPETICYLTIGTKTGKNIAQKNIKADVISFLPYDFLLPMLLAFRRIKPTSLIIIEAEIWPNLLMLAHFKKIPTYSINARISDRSKKRYHLFKFALLPLLNIFEKIYTQSEKDKKEFELLGINQEKLSVLGDIKAFNVLEKHKQLGLSKKENHEKTLLVGSVHPGEIDYYLNMFKKLRYKHKDLKIIIAPRHFNWQKELIEKVKTLKIPFFVWDKTNKRPEDFDILLVCKLGELFKLYSEATIFFLGGTFVPIGGHNLLEPAVWSNPTIIGPHYQNCAVIAEKLAKEKALIKVKTEQELIKIVETLLDDPEDLEKMGERAILWLEKEGKIVEDKLSELLNSLELLRSVL